LPRMADTWSLILLARTAQGRCNLAYRLVSQTTYPGWGYMVRNGATTIWELWNDDTANSAMNSGNHLMLVDDLVTRFYEYLADISTDAAELGFEHSIMRPDPVGNLTFVRASTQFPCGKIVSAWERNGDRFTWNLRVLANTTATVFVLTREKAFVTESGKPADLALGVKFLWMDEGAAECDVGSGN